MITLDASIRVRIGLDGGVAARILDSSWQTPDVGHVTCLRSRVDMSDREDGSRCPDDGVVTGNVYDKYRSSNPFVRWIMSGFRASLWKLVETADPSDVLDVGTGEGFVAQALASRHPSMAVHGIDLAAPELIGKWKDYDLKNLSFSAGSAYDLSFTRDTFDLVLCLEVLEHLGRPETALEELVRVSGGWVLASVPREPLWRMLNLARGAYVTDWGNTPGHVNHWSKRSFLRLMRQFGGIVRVESPFPWTMVLLRPSHLVQ